MRMGRKIGAGRVQDQCRKRSRSVRMAGQLEAGRLKMRAEGSPDRCSTRPSPVRKAAKTVAGPGLGLDERKLSAYGQGLEVSKTAICP